jgi:uncharacterized protein (DUF1499 family)
MTDAAASARSSRKLVEWRNLAVRVAVALCIAAPAFFVIAAFGVKYQVFTWNVGFDLLTMRVLPALALAAVAAEIAALVLIALVRPARFRRAIAVSAIAPLAVLGVWGWLATSALHSPPIHDISTDLENPPGFSPLVSAERALARGGNMLDDFRSARVPLEGAGEAAGLKVSAVQQVAYPDIQPIATGAEPSRALSASVGAAQHLGWTIDRVDTQAGVIEAREIGFWFGAVADIAIRVSAANPGSVVDVRSTSRLGLSDLGANARRVRAFQQALAHELTM